MSVHKVVEENEEILAKAVEKLIWLEKSGSLDALIDLVSLIKLIQDSISDAVVLKHAEVITDLGLISAKFTNDRALMLLNAIGDAICMCEKELKPAGIKDLITALRDPDVKVALGMILNILKQLGKNLQK